MGTGESVLWGLFPVLVLPELQFADACGEFCYHFYRRHTDVLYPKKLGNAVSKKGVCGCFWVCLVLLGFFLTLLLYINVRNGWNQHSKNLDYLVNHLVNQSVCLTEIKSVCVYCILPGVLSFQQVCWSLSTAAEPGCAAAWRPLGFWSSRRGWMRIANVHQKHHVSRCFRAARGGSECSLLVLLLLFPSTFGAADSHLKPCSTCFLLVLILSTFAHAIACHLNFHLIIIY